MGRHAPAGLAGGAGFLTSRAAREHVAVAAAFQAYVDGGVSKTVNLAQSVSLEGVREVFVCAHKMGCKGITVYRDGCARESLIKIKPTVLDEEAVYGPLPPKDARPIAIAERPKRKLLPDTRSSITHAFSIGPQEGYLSVGMYEDGTPAEMFLIVAKGGSTVRGMADCFAIAISLCLQYGVPLRDLVKKFTLQRFDPSGPTSNKDIPFARSMVDYIFRFMNREFGEDVPVGEEDPMEEMAGDLCPTCGSPLIHVSGCASCVCGWSNCS